MGNCDGSMVYRKAYGLAVEVVKLCRQMQEQQKEYVLSKQLVTQTDRFS